MILTASNERVQAYLLGNIPPTTTAKKKRLEKFEKLLQTFGLFLSELFPNKQKNVLDEILYLTSGCGICKIGADRLAERAGVSERTVSTAVRQLKSTDQYIVARINSGHAGKYIFVDKLHPNFKEIMDFVFNLDAEQFAYPVASLQQAENLDITVSNNKKLDSNYSSSFIKTSFLYNNNLLNEMDNEAIQEIQKAIDEEPVINLDTQKEYLNEYATNEYQHLIFDTMRIFPLHKELENNLYKLSLRVGSNATIKEFNIAKNVMFELNMQLIQATTEIKNSVTALFSLLYKEALLNTNHSKELIEPNNTVSSNAIFYNWLDERENYDLQPKTQPNSPFFYNWLDEREN